MTIIKIQINSGVNLYFYIWYNMNRKTSEENLNENHVRFWDPA